MKYDVLERFKEHLKSTSNKNTARKYYSAIVKLFKDKQFNDVSQIKKSVLETELPLKFKTKNEFSAAKNGLLRLKEVYPDIELPEELFFREHSRKKRNYSKKPKKTIELDKTMRKINQISNKKLKLAYRLAIISGLRVSELEGLEKADLKFKDGIITVNVKHGKGGSNGLVICKKDDYVYKELENFIENLEENEKVFYSEEYMREKAKNLDLECHDFRRIFAITLRNELKKTMPVQEANAIVQKQLRHKRFSTTKRYLFNKKLVVRS